MVLPQHPPRHWPTDRLSGTRPPPGDPIYQQRHPMDISTMLEQYCDIHLNHFIMVGFTKDGRRVIFSGPRETANGNSNVLQYIDLEGYTNWYNNGATFPTPSPSAYDDGYFGHDDLGRRQINSTYGGRRQFDRRRTQNLYDYEDDASYNRSRKRPRAAPASRRDAAVNAGPAVQVAVAKRGLRIGDEEEVAKFYDQRFRSCQQSACKVIAKAWIKLIAPKKQTNHPYTGKDEKAPDWWPKPWGTTREEKIRHKEPDHLHKHERLPLLKHMLRMITEPNRTQHRDIQKLGINVAKLEEATFEAMSSFLNDPDKPNNAKARQYLKEIFRVARYEERYRNGEVDADAKVMVTAGDKEIIEDEEEDTQEGGDEHDGPTPTTSPKPEQSLPVLPAPPEQGTPSDSLQSGAAFHMGDIPVRTNTYTQASLMQPDLSSGPSSFDPPPMSQTHGMPIQDAYSDPHVPNRRTSLYASPADYGNSSGSGMYQTWPQNNTPTASSGYSFQQQPQQPHPAAQYVDHQPVSLQQTPQYLEATPSFETMHGGSTSLYRQPTVPQGTVNTHTAHNFPYMKMDNLNRPQTHDENDNKRWS